MQILLNNTTWDLDFSDPKALQWVDETEEIRQHIKQRLWTVRGEWFMNIKLGVPYWTDVFIKNPDIVKLSDAFKSVILGTLGVIALLRYDWEYSSTARTFNLYFAVQTDYGVIDFNETLTTIQGV